MTESNTHLRIATTATIVMGIAFAIGGVFPSALGMDALLEALFWPSAARGELSDLGRLGVVVAGGVLAGFGVAMDRLTRLPEGADRGDIAAALLAGLAVWFVVDSTGSVLVGATVNVLGNVAYLVLVAPPLLVLRRMRRRAVAT